MNAISEKLEQLQGRIVLLCIGNPDGGDDAVGVRLGEELRHEGLDNVLVAEVEPERSIARGETDGFDHVILVDAVDFGAAPGSIAFLGADQMTARFAQVSTHRLSLGMLARWIQVKGGKAWLLGIQPQTLSPGWKLSVGVQAAMATLREVLTHRFGAGAGAC